MNKIIIFITPLMINLSVLFSMETECNEENSQKKHLVTKKPMVAGASNFILDQIHLATSSFVREHGLTEGDTILIDTAQKEALLRAATDSALPLLMQSSGGAVSNTLSCLARLGIHARAMGSAVAGDVFGGAYLADLTRKGVEYRLTETIDPSQGSGACYIFITEAEYVNTDGSISKKIERTMGTHIGDAGSIRVYQDDIDWMSEADMFIAEGYLFCETARDAMFELAAGVKAKGKLVTLSIAAGFCATTYKESLNQFIDEQVDIVIGDKSEALTLTNRTDVRDAIAAWQAMGKKGAITCGIEGAYVFDDAKIYHIEPPSIGTVIDATGAGDGFAAGFVAEILKTGDIVNAGKLGAYCAGSVLQVAGGYPPESLAKDIALGLPWFILHNEIN